jgi:hypothetical protein
VQRRYGCELIRVRTPSANFRSLLERQVARRGLAVSVIGGMLGLVLDGRRTRES